MSLVIGVLAGAGTALLGLPYFVVLQGCSGAVRAGADVRADPVGGAGGDRGALPALADRRLG